MSGAGSAGAFVRDPDNPSLRAGHTYSDGLRDLNVSDPNLSWDDAAQQFDLYYMGAHAAQFSDPGVQQIHHATSPDGSAWTISDTPALVAASDGSAWDHTNSETPSVAYNPDAPAGRQYVLAYSGANGDFPGETFASYAIGVAFSADGQTFTRVAAAESPHGEDGLVLTGSDAYPTASGAIVADSGDRLRRRHVSPVVLELRVRRGLSDRDRVRCRARDVDRRRALDGRRGSGRLAAAHARHADDRRRPAERRLRRRALPLRDVVDLGSIGRHERAAVVFNNMAGVWRATSSDAVTWSIDFAGTRDLTWDMTAPGEPLGLLTGVDVAIKDDARVMAYVGFDDQDVPAGYFLPEQGSPGFGSGVMALDLARRTDSP